jgi:hypothetical protein
VFSGVAVAAGGGSRMADHRYHVTVSPRPRAQDAKTILSVVVGYSLDETGQHFPGVRLRSHADHRISISLANRLEAASIFFL